MRSKLRRVLKSYRGKAEIMIIKSFCVGFIHNDCYVVRAEDSHTAALIDAPFGSYEKISAYCTQNALTVEGVLVTHGHFDHIGELAKWQEKGAKIYVHKNDADKLSDNAKNLAGKFAAYLTPVSADVTVSDGDSVACGGLNFKVIHTPGHSSGSVCYLCDRALFTGDTLFHSDTGRVDFDDGCASDMIKSVKKLFALDGDFDVYPGHEEATTLDDERASNSINYYLK